MLDYWTVIELLFHVYYIILFRVSVGCFSLGDRWQEMIGGGGGDIFVHLFGGSKATRGGSRWRRRVVKQAKWSA